MAKIDTKDRPYTSNYPPLEEWLKKHNARCNWQVPFSKREEAFIESWSMPNGFDFIVLVHAHRRGWNLYTAERSGEIVPSLEDAERRLGLLDVKAPPKVDADGVCEACEAMPDGSDGRVVLHFEGKCCTLTTA